MAHNEKALVKKRGEWLDENELTPRQFAESMDLDYNTIIRWFSEPRVPQRLLRERVQKKWPDFPVE